MYYVYVYMCVCIYIYIYTYIYVYNINIHNKLGSALMGSLQILCVFTGEPFGYSR